jgi:dipeptidyl aminopeptidase/acylaminoacyl peptidase
MPRVAPFGRWPSPLSADALAVGRLSLSELQSDGATLYWLEARPSEAGRVVFVRMSPDGEPEEHGPAEVSIRSRVHEYGGGAVCLVPHQRVGAFAYVDGSDQRVWFSDGPSRAAAPRPLTAKPPQGQSWRHGGLRASPDGGWVLAVREAHDDGPGDAQPHRSIVACAVHAAGPIEATILIGHDFYGTPDLHEGDDRLVAVAWDHPDMPWDATRLVVVQLIRTTDEQGIEHLTAQGEPWAIAGGPSESVGQPAWRPDGTLRFVSDRTGWWQPYLHSGWPDGHDPQAVTDLKAEFHGPDWNLSQRTMADLPDGSLVARLTTQGRDGLVRWPEPGSEVATAPTTLGDAWSSYVAISSLCAHGDRVAVIASTPDAPAAIVCARPGAATPAPRPRSTSTSTATPTPLEPGDIARAEPLAIAGANGRTVHALFYRPTLSDTSGPANQRPPLIVICHGGPTAAAPAGFDPAVQFFTTRGFAVVAPNYAGSTGYGRAYREALNGRWGIADAEDCLHTARYLADLVDPDRMAVRGTSAGGFTALNALAAGPGFAAAVSWYGITDLHTLAATTHDFEAHYNDRLIGPLPKAARKYTERSPLTHAGDITGAVLLLQGADDPVVPPSQARQLHDALRAAGHPCELRVFEGEGHGFRRAETLTAAYESELDFYRRHLNL